MLEVCSESYMRSAGHLPVRGDGCQVRTPTEGDNSVKLSMNEEQLALKTMKMRR